MLGYRGEASRASSESSMETGASFQRPGARARLCGVLRGLYHASFEGRVARKRLLLIGTEGASSRGFIIACMCSGIGVRTEAIKSARAGQASACGDVALVL